MKHILYVLVVCNITLSGVSQNQHDEQLVKQTANSWFNSFNKHNYYDYPSYTTEDCYGVNPFGFHGKRTSETPAIYTRAHETFLKNASLIVDSMSIRFIRPEVAIATVFSTQKGTTEAPPGMDKSLTSRAGERLISTMVIVKQDNKWLITQYQNTFNLAPEAK